MRNLVSPVIPSVALATCLLLTGCSLDSFTPPTLKSATGLAIRGNVHGGQQPIVGAHIYLLAAGTSGYGAPSTSLLNSGTDGSDAIGGYVLTAADGSFSYGGDYTCTPNTQVYLYASGGDPGAGPNSAAGLLAAIGNCPAAGNFATSVPFVWINEVTTVAAAYAFSAYATDATHVSSPATTAAVSGIANAFATASNLADITSGSALATTPAGNGTVPQAEINTLANILASCVNSTGPASSACSALFSNAMSNGSSGITPADTATAAINIAHNPAATVAALFNIPAAIAAFAPVLPTQPADFTLTLSFSGGGIQSPAGVALDATGNAWINNASSISKLSPLGAVQSPSSGYTDPSLSNPQGLALDAAGHIWLANYTGNSLTEFDSSGALLANITNPNLNYPSSIAFDSTGSLWVANYASSALSQFNPSGAYINTFTGPGLYLPFQVVSDTLGNVWAPNPNQTKMARFNSAGADPSGPWLAAGLTPAFGNVIAGVDSTNNIWVINQDASISALTSSGTALPGTPFNTGSGAQPSAFTLDGQGNLWATVSTFDPMTFTQSPSLIGFTSSGAQLMPSGHPLSAQGTDLAIDGSGNIWITTGSHVEEVVGAAAPVVTPIAAAVANNSLASRP